MNPFEHATIVIAALVAGLMVGAVLAALTARTRQMDDQQRTEAAFRELAHAVEQVGDPTTRARLLRELGVAWDRVLPDGTWHLDGYRRPEPAPARTEPYVHRILDAYATGNPVDLSGCAVPPDVRGRLRAILAGASERTAALPDRVPVTGLSSAFVIDTTGLPLVRPGRST